MTKEEIEKNFGYRAWKKEILQDFPIISKISLSDNFEKDWEEFDATFFVEADVSLSKIKELYPELVLRDYAKFLMDEEGEIMRVFTLHEIFDTPDKKIIGDFEDGIEEVSWDFYKDLRDRKDVPTPMKLPRRPAIIRFRLIP